MGSRQLGELLLRPTPVRNLAIPQTSRAIWPRSTPCLHISQRNSSSNSKPGPGAPAPTQVKEAEGSEDKPASSQDALSKGLGDIFSSPNPNAKTSTSSMIDAIYSSSTVDQNKSSSGYAAAARMGMKARPFGADFSQPRAPGLGLRPQRTNWGDQALPEGFDNARTPAMQNMPEAEPVYPRLNPSYGRMVELAPEKGRDLVRGLGMLGGLMARNKVKNDFYKQRFHERPGLKRKRLKSERWRARFKKEFDATCKRVTELTRKGW